MTTSVAPECRVCRRVEGYMEFRDGSWVHLACWREELGSVDEDRSDLRDPAEFSEDIYERTRPL